MGKFGEQLSVVLLAIIGLAIVAVLVSKNAQTGTVISDFSKGFAGIIGAAVAPVTGGIGSLGNGSVL